MVSLTTQLDFTTKVIPVYILWFNIFSTTYVTDIFLLILIIVIIEGFFTNFWRKNLQAISLKVQLS